MERIEPIPYMNVYEVTPKTCDCSTLPCSQATSFELEDEVFFATIDIKDLT